MPASAQDAFTPSRSWGPVGSGSEASERLAAAAQFRQKHKFLGCTLQRDGGMAALLDTKFIRPGEVVDGFRLVELNEHAALFDSGEIQVELTVVGQGNATSDNLVIKPARGNSW